MNPQIKEKWVAALRSGKYEQGRGCLRNEAKNAFCCLGVLVDIIEPGAYSNVGPPRPLSSPYALAEITEQQIDRCVRLNDAEKQSFPQIADYIEANL